MYFLANAILIDTSAAIALSHQKDQFHIEAQKFFNATDNVVWVTLNATAHETYTRARYDIGFNQAITLYDFLTGKPLYQISFQNDDEKEARSLLERYSDHKISFHDALCASVMKRIGIYRIFSFDYHFFTFGFEVFPGVVR
jgi:predicted nucleic acid-binding protein